MPKALIVEDEPEANELLAMLVGLRGYRTDSAFNGAEALALASAGPSRPDVVFLDLMLPDINGFDVCKALKGRRDTGAIPVVLVTARLAAENRLRGFRAGATDFIPKPYTPDQIFGAMDRADAWSRELAIGGPEGEIPLDARSDLDHLRAITRLWGLLLARTTLAEDDARAIDQALVDLACRAVDWGARASRGRVATLRHRRDPGRFTLTLIDDSGWLAEDPPVCPEGLGGIIARGRFDEVAVDEAAGRVVMTRHFAG